VYPRSRGPTFLSLFSVEPPSEADAAHSVFSFIEARLIILVPLNNCHQQRGTGNLPSGNLTLVARSRLGKGVERLPNSIKHLGAQSCGTSCGQSSKEKT